MLPFPSLSQAQGGRHAPHPASLRSGSWVPDSALGAGRLVALHLSLTSVPDLCSLPSGEVGKAGSDVIARGHPRWIRGLRRRKPGELGRPVCLCGPGYFRRSAQPVGERNVLVRSQCVKAGKKDSWERTGHNNGPGAREGWAWPGSEARGQGRDQAGGGRVESQVGLRQVGPLPM